MTLATDTVSPSENPGRVAPAMLNAAAPTVRRSAFSTGGTAAVETCGIPRSVQFGIHLEQNGLRETVTSSLREMDPR